MYVSGFIKVLKRSMCTMKNIDEKLLESMSRSLAMPLLETNHKGEAGRIGIVGGSLEYTGAPYFAGISALKVGADLIHIFCAREAGTVIKTYSPELIVHPVLDEPNAIESIRPWLDRLHVLVIGPGLGRDQGILDNVTSLINVCRSIDKPLVIDADGLFLISNNNNLIKDYPGVILTPNGIEYKRLFYPQENKVNAAILEKFGENCVVLKKGLTDEISSGHCTARCTITTGSGRRSGGQGDLLAGSLAAFYHWALKAPVSEHNVFAACYAASKLTKECNARAFKRLGRSMTTTDMITEIGSVFNDFFERK